MDEFQDYIIERKNLLVPQDIRERKGAFFTPRIWVELSQKYLTNCLGKDWQDNYYIWDCAAGTGNLLAGLSNKHNIYASTLDQADINVMHERIDQGANLLKNHVFQFDFLNDEFNKLPQSLQDIINDKEKRRKLLIYINPPYAEATSTATTKGTASNKAGVSTDNKVNAFYREKIGNASNEIFALFMAKIYDKYPDVILGIFSTLKFIQGSNFRSFKNYFLAKYLAGFVVPANTFDNVKGKFPIGFTIWDLSKKEKIDDIRCDVYNKNKEFICTKRFYGNLPKSINKWLTLFYGKELNNEIGVLSTRGNDFQNQKFIYIATKIENKTHDTKVKITISNLRAICVYFSVRHCKPADWLNDRDQFLYPNSNWQFDEEFQNDCLAYTLFHSQNKISINEGVNHWIPFTENEVNSKEKFQSHFMSDFINGKLNIKKQSEIYEQATATTSKKIKFSCEAEALFHSGRELWIYYHSHPNCNVNASLYDIKEYFQGRSKNGRMNNKSNDETYTKLLDNLKDNLKILAKKIEAKLYLYGFLKE